MTDEKWYQSEPLRKVVWSAIAGACTAAAAFVTNKVLSSTDTEKDQTQDDSY